MKQFIMYYAQIVPFAICIHTRLSRLSSLLETSRKCQYCFHVHMVIYAFHGAWHTNIETKHETSSIIDTIGIFKGYDRFRCDRFATGCKMSYNFDVSHVSNPRWRNPYAWNTIWKSLLLVAKYGVSFITNASTLSEITYRSQIMYLEC